MMAKSDLFFSLSSLSLSLSTPAILNRAATVDEPVHGGVGAYVITLAGVFVCWQMSICSSGIILTLPFFVLSCFLFSFLKRT